MIHEVGDADGVTFIAMELIRGEKLSDIAAIANLKAGRDAESAELFERLQSGYERLTAMESYARSLFLLGQIYERRGDTARARDRYRRFVQFWRDGDLERGWVAEAQKGL